MDLGRKYHMGPQTAKRYAMPPQKPEYTLGELKPMEPDKQIVDEPFPLHTGDESD